ncbi:MAG: serine acetyltransferase [Acidobacteria bacterium]|nr:serine acetyltransferase [Acidobacteriota bacterium]
MSSSPSFAERLLAVRHAHTPVLPDRSRVPQFVEDLVELLFPQIEGGRAYTCLADIQSKLDRLGGDLAEILGPQRDRVPGGIDQAVHRFFAALPDVYATLWQDARTIHEGDPASESLDEVIAAYPGFFAVYTYRVAHVLHGLRIPLLPRLFTEYAHVRTGIDIHPGARIGERFCIDHGTGIVIGGTCEIGTSVKMYQGVSLGALSVSKDLAGTKRHPTIEDNVVIYSNATILGGRTRIGHDSVIGGNVWLTESVPAYSIVQHRSEVKVRSRQVEDHAIDFVI